MAINISSEMKKRMDVIKASRAKQKADYLNSPKGLARETIKGLPEATKKVGRAIGGGIGKAAKAIGYQLKGGKYGETQGKRFDLNAEIKKRNERGLKPLKQLKLLK